MSSEAAPKPEGSKCNSFLTKGTSPFLKLRCGEKFGQEYWNHPCFFFSLCYGEGCFVINKNASAELKKNTYKGATRSILASRHPCVLGVTEKGSPSTHPSELPGFFNLILAAH